MFVKPFRVKTNTRIRGSERKELRSKIQSAFQSYEFEEPITSIISNKDDINVLKLFTHKKEVVIVYVVNKNPLFFEVKKSFYPTVYFLWKYPTLIPVVTTSSPVINKLGNGADLMLPGVIIPSEENISNFSKGTAVAINTDNNASSLAVGSSLLTSNQMFHLKERQGKAVQVLHVFGDYLWKEGEQLQPPRLEFKMNLNEIEGENESETDKHTMESVDFTSNPTTDDALQANKDNFDGNNVTETCSTPSLEEGSQQCQSVENINGDSEEISSVTKDFDNVSLEEPTEAEKMNNLLNSCVMTALKVKLKDKELPFPIGAFYRSKVLSCCPSDTFLDIKKTKYKKLSKYMKTLEESGLIQMKEITKGTDHIILVNRSHEDLRSFQPLIEEKPEVADTPNAELQFDVLTQKRYEAPEITQLYGVNSKTLPLFRVVGCNKGSVLEPSTVRELVTRYVHENELAKEQLVNLDPILHHILFGKGNVDIERVKWDVLFSKIFSAMQPHYQMLFKGANPIVLKGTLPKVIVKLEQRMGNKKVTLVHNLEHFFIRPDHFASEIKKKAQASVSMSRLPGCKPSLPIQQVLIQGTQLRNVEQVLTGDNFKLPRKYIDGLQAVPKAKGNKRK